MYGRHRAIREPGARTIQKGETPFRVRPAGGKAVGEKPYGHSLRSC